METVFFHPYKDGVVRSINIYQARPKGTLTLTFKPEEYEVMSRWDDNIYYHPDVHGCTILYELDTNEPYSFDMFVVWKHEGTGNLYYSTDSGCSCPSPFESYNKLEDLIPINRQTWDMFYNQLMGSTQYTMAERQALLTAVNKEKQQCLTP